MLRLSLRQVLRGSVSFAAMTASTAWAFESPADLFRLPEEPPAATAPLSAPIEADVVKERYPNGQLKIERTVTLDAQENYVNHGLWTMWDEKGRVLGGGEYDHGQREGRWSRNFHQGEAEVLAAPLAAKFQAPFTAEANFSEGKLNGVWTMVDAKQRVVFAWTYEEGKRHGKSVWCYPNGQPYREANYVRGELDGDVLELGQDKSLVRKDLFVSGRQVSTKVEWHAAGKKKQEATFLLAKDSEGSVDDFWTGAVRPIPPVGPITGDERHGPWTSWHRNGQIAMQGNYEHDQPNGPFTWWHTTGQKAIEGTFCQGKPSGPWTWWHENGLKEMRGAFVVGLQAGKWNRWNEDGKVAEAMNFPESGASDGEVATSPLPMPGVLNPVHGDPSADEIPKPIPTVQAARVMKRR